MTQPRAVNLWTALPIATLMGKAASTTQKAVQEFFSGAHQWLADGVQREIDVENVVVAPQPVGAMFDHLLTDSGEMPTDKKLLFKKELGILGIR